MFAQELSDHRKQAPEGMNSLCRKSAVDFDKSHWSIMKTDSETDAAQTAVIHQCMHGSYRSTEGIFTQIPSRLVSRFETVNRPTAFRHT